MICVGRAPGAAPAAMTPEQAGNWAYPQPASSEQENAFTLCGALLGRIHLSGHLDQMSSDQQVLVARAISAYKLIRSELPEEDARGLRKRIVACIGADTRLFSPDPAVA